LHYNTATFLSYPDSLCHAIVRNGDGGCRFEWFACRARRHCEGWW